MSGPWQELLGRVRELVDLDGIVGILSWDEETYAPVLSRGPRGRQVATLEAIQHQRLVDPALGELLYELEGQAPRPDRQPDEERAALLRLVRRRRDHALRVPEALVRALAEARSRALASWEEARQAGDAGYRMFAPHLATVLQLSRERAAALSPSAGGDLYDALLDEHEPGMTRAVMAPVLHELRRGLDPILQAIAAGPRPDRSFLSRQPFDPEEQWRFTLRLLGDLGFDFQRGRQDRSSHPFTQVCSEHDVRVTTRISPMSPLSGLLATVHEAGHGLYDQGLRPEHHGTFLAEGSSTGLHESQARMWENQVARSLAFLGHYQPILARHFPAQLRGVSLDALYRAVNAVEPGLIRVEADEVTYNLHILLRYELEISLLLGDLAPRDLPGAWNDKMREYLGVVPDSDITGCLQDVHWALGSIGYFPTYAIGNLYAAQLMDACERERRDLWTGVGRGHFGVLLHWLRDRVHRHGHLRSAEAIIQAATGQGMSVAPFLAYLRRKYGELYPGLGG